jgi:hypothetical protein
MKKERFSLPTVAIAGSNLYFGQVDYMEELKVGRFFGFVHEQVNGWSS